MIATTKIKMDLTGAGNMPWIDLMQNDSCSRNLQISLFTGVTPFMIPEDCTALVRYSKPDGKGGVYDTLPDGTKAYSFSENRVTVTLAPQVSTAAGRVELTISLLRAGAQLSCFSLQLMVHAQPGGKESERYVNVTAFLPQTGNAKVGQLLKVTETENGTVRAMETVAMPQALPNPKPLMVGGNCYDGSAVVEVPIPDAVRADVAQEAERVAEAACQRQGEGTLTFLVCSDAHHSLAHPNGTQLAESLNHGAQAMGLIRDKVHLDFFAMLGDVIWDAGETPRQAMAAMRYVNSLVAK